MMEESPERKKSKHEFQFEKCLCCPERTGIAIPYVYTHSMLQDVLAMTVPRKDKKKHNYEKCLFSLKPMPLKMSVHVGTGD